MKSILSLLKSFGSNFNESFVIADIHQEDMPLIYVNDAFTEVTGYSKEEIVGRNCRFLQGPKTSKETSVNLKSSIKDLEPCYYDILNHKKSGVLFWNRLVLLPIGESDEHPDYYVGIQHQVDRDNAVEAFNSTIESHAIGKRLDRPFKDILNLLREFRYLHLNSEAAEFESKRKELKTSISDEITKLSKEIREISY